MFSLHNLHNLHIFGEKQSMSTQKQSDLLCRLGYSFDSAQLSTGEAAALIKQLKQQRPQIDTEQIRRDINLIDYAGRYTALSKKGKKEFEGACPKCNGSNRFYCQPSFFACRQCYPMVKGSGRRHDAIGFVMWIDGVDFVEAVAILTDQPLPVAIDRVTPATKPNVLSPENEWNEPYQCDKAWNNCCSLLKALSAPAKDSVRYLQKRSIKAATVKAFQIGWCKFHLPATWDDVKRERIHPNQTAISLPWFNHDGALVAVRYRFIQPHTYTGIDGSTKKEVRMNSEFGSCFGGAFGWQALHGASKCDVLIVCEGEMNALSIWQAGNGRVDVLSIGSESSGIPVIVIELAKQYKHAIVWTDKGDVADSIALSIGAASMRSPIIDGYPKGADANDLLRLGKLEMLLNHMLSRLGVQL